MSRKVRDMKTALGKWMERAKREQDEVATLLGITQGHLSHLVNGKRTPSLRLAAKISTLTGIPPADLIGKAA